MIEDIKITSKLLNDFRNYESKRSSFFMSYNVLPKILEWHIEMWRKEVNLLGKEMKPLIYGLNIVNYTIS